MSSKEFRQLREDFRKGKAAYNGAVVKQIFPTGVIMVEVAGGGVEFIDLMEVG